MWNTLSSRETSNDIVSNVGIVNRMNIYVYNIELHMQIYMVYYSRFSTEKI